MRPRAGRYKDRDARIAAHAGQLRKDRRILAAIRAAVEPGATPDFDALARRPEMRAFYNSHRWHGDIMISLMRIWHRRSYLDSDEAATTFFGHCVV